MSLRMDALLMLLLSAPLIGGLSCVHSSPFFPNQTSSFQITFVNTSTTLEMCTLLVNISTAEPSCVIDSIQLGVGEEQIEEKRTVSTEAHETTTVAVSGIHATMDQSNLLNGTTSSPNGAIDPLNGTTDSFNGSKSALNNTELLETTTPSDNKELDMHPTFYCREEDNCNANLEFTKEKREQNKGSPEYNCLEVEIEKFGKLVKDKLDKTGVTNNLPTLPDDDNGSRTSTTFVTEIFPTEETPSFFAMEFLFLGIFGIVIVVYITGVIVKFRQRRAFEDAR